MGAGGAAADAGHRRITSPTRAYVRVAQEELLVNQFERSIDESAAVFWLLEDQPLRIFA